MSDPCPNCAYTDLRIIDRRMIWELFDTHADGLIAQASQAATKCELELCTQLMAAYIEVESLRERLWAATKHAPSADCPETDPVHGKRVLDYAQDIKIDTGPGPYGMPVEPSCEQGYTREDLLKLFGSKMLDFDQWMNGQTQSICEGKLYNHYTGEYEESCNGVSHGVVAYSWDVAKFWERGKNSVVYD